LDELSEKQYNIVIEKNNPKRLSDEIISLLSKEENIYSTGQSAKVLAKEIDG